MLLRTVICGWLLAACAGASGQGSAPTTEQMIEQLKTTPRTRSLRNLVVEAAPAADNAAASPATPAAGVTAAPATEPAPSLSLRVQFDFDSARIRPESMLALSNLAAALNAPVLAQSRFAVEGHTDAKGNADYNRRLSEQRALAVRDFLVSKSVEISRLQASGKGSSELANKSDPLSAENRRVRVVNLD